MHRRHYFVRNGVQLGRPAGLDHAHGLLQPLVQHLPGDQGCSCQLDEKGQHSRVQLNPIIPLQRACEVIMHQNDTDCTVMHERQCNVWPSLHAQRVLSTGPKGPRLGGLVPAYLSGYGQWRGPALRHAHESFVMTGDIMSRAFNNQMPIQDSPCMLKEDSAHALQLACSRSSIFSRLWLNLNSRL